MFDYDGDGRDDLLNTCGGGTDYIQVFVATDKGFQAVEVDAASTTKYPLWVWPADLNGDSLTDLVVCGGDKTRTPVIRFGRGPGKGFDPARTLPILFPLGENGYPPSWAACERQPAFVDVDGDGIANLLVSIRKGSPKAADFQESWKSLVIGPNAAVWKDTGLVFDGPQEHTGNGDLPVAVNHDVPLAGQHQLRFLDANGDRLADALRLDDGLVTLRLNTGRGFGPATRVLEKRPDWAWHELSAYSFRRAVTRDLDRDGRDDLLLPYGRADQPNRLRWVLYSARGAGFEPAEAAQWSLAYRVSPLTADVDGDDSPDLITAVDEPGLRDGPTEGLRMVVRYGDSARGNLLTSVLDGVGRSVVFDYSAAVDGERVYRRTADCKTRQSWCRARVGPLVGAVTVQVAERDGPVGVDDTVWRRVRRTTFRYEDARVGWYGRGSLGVGRRVEQSFGATDDERGDTITRRYGNDVFHDTEPDTTVRQWYPFHEQVLEQTTVSAPVRQGLTDPRSERRTVTTVSRPEVRISAAGQAVRDGPVDRADDHHGSRGRRVEPPGRRRRHHRGGQRRRQPHKHRRQTPERPGRAGRADRDHRRVRRERRAAYAVAAGPAAPAHSAAPARGCRLAAGHPQHLGRPWAERRDDQGTRRSGTPAGHRHRPRRVRQRDTDRRRRTRGAGREAAS
nr:hypothetical protein GCM10020092_033420 [Actinoplanes digitatis]